ncbi:MAG: pilin [Candidatus Paceibacterota bacterium]
MKKLFVFVILFVLFIPVITSAAGLVPCGGPEEDECSACDLLILFQNVLKKALEIAFLIVIGSIVYGGFRWIFSGGNEASIKTGQKIITNAIIGFVIILCAWLIVNTVFWVIKQMGGTEKYTGNWFHIDCSELSGWTPVEPPIDDDTTDGETPEVQIEKKKNEIESKYPELIGKWSEEIITCPWDTCEEAYGTAKCDISSKIKDGFCFALGTSVLLNSPGDIHGNEWHCVFGKKDINSPNPGGVAFAYCIPNKE